MVASAAAHSGGRPDLPLSQRALGVEDSVTLAVTNRASELRRQGRPVIGFGAGEPDFATPEHIVAAARSACADPAGHHYSPAAGLPELRAAVADKTRRDSGYDVAPEQVIVSNGGKQALYLVFQALLDPGDEVLLPAPYWVTYPEQIRLAGGRPVVVETRAADGYRVTVDQLDAATSDATKALVFVSPSNPTGVVYPPDEVEAIGRWAAQRDIWVVTDEIYEHLVYGDARSVSLPVVVPEVADRCVVINGVAKTYAMTGWRVGWAVGPPSLIAATARLQSHLSSNVANVSQRAALAALTGPQDCVEEMRAVFDRRRRVAVDLLRTIDALSFPEPDGAFYLFPDCSKFLGGRIGERTVRSSLDLAEALLDEAEVAVVPGEGFGAPGCIRLSYALGDAELEEGLRRLVGVLRA